MNSSFPNHRLFLHEARPTTVWRDPPKLPPRGPFPIWEGVPEAPSPHLVT